MSSLLGYAASVITKSSSNSSIKRKASSDSTPRKKKTQKVAREYEKGLYPNMVYMSITKNKLIQRFGSRYQPLPEVDYPIDTDPEQVRTELVPQRSDLWFSIREGRITGSVVKDFLCFTYERYKKRIGLGMAQSTDPLLLYKKFVEEGKMDKTEIEPYTQSWVNMTWGSLHEFSAIFVYLEAVEAVSKGADVLPAGMPDRWVETGIWLFTKEKYEEIMKGYPGKAARFEILPPLAASPDGLYPDINNPTVCFEIKCRSVYCQEKGFFRQAISHNPGGRGQPFVALPTYYVPQIQMQMLITGAQKCVFISWTPSSGTNVFIVEKDVEYCQLLLDMIASNHLYALFCTQKDMEMELSSFVDDPRCVQVIEMSERISKDATLHQLGKRSIHTHAIDIADIGHSRFLDQNSQSIIDMFKDTDLLLDLLDGKDVGIKISRNK